MSLRSRPRMVLVDVNLLVHAVNVDFSDHARAAAWLQSLWRQDTLVALPWVVLIAFVRITTNRRAMVHPLTLEEALEQIDAWLVLPTAVVLAPGQDHARHFAALCHAASAVGNLVSDAHLAAMAVERDCELASNDADFALFPGLRWFNPLV